MKSGMNSKLILPESSTVNMRFGLTRFSDCRGFNASGVGAAWPQAGIPLGVVASLVAYSRVHTGVHYPSDTIAGTVCGVALAPVAVAAVERRREQQRRQSESRFTKLLPRSRPAGS